MEYPQQYRDKMCIFEIFIHTTMRTNIVIDEDLMAKAMKLLGLKTKRATVEEALRIIISLKEQKQIRSFRGQLKWDGDLDEMRKG